MKRNTWATILLTIGILGILNDSKNTLPGKVALWMGISFCIASAFLIEGKKKN